MDKNDSNIVVFRRVPKIFICHSSLDESLLNEIKKTITETKIIPFLANREVTGMNPLNKIVSAMEHSDALFAVLTKNALNNKSTRDWIFFEIGLAKGMWQKYDTVLKHKQTRRVWEQYRIYGWKDPNISLPSDSPIKFLTDYQPLKIRSRKSRNEMLKNMKDIAEKIYLYQ